MVEPKSSDRLSLDIYFDYLCPYVYRAAIWLQRVQADLGPQLTINWKYFSLEQVNNDEGPRWKLWEQPQDYPSPGRRAFWAAEAARQQNEAAFASFHIALLKAQHEQQRDIADMNTLGEVARSVNLDLARFHKDLGNRRLLAKLAQDHTFAVETLGVFGTPTRSSRKDKPSSSRCPRHRHPRRVLPSLPKFATSPSGDGMRRR